MPGGAFYAGLPMRTVKDYHAYLASDKWKAKHAEYFGRWCFRRECFVCGSKKGLHLHHRTYENLGAESPSDLVALCAACHLTIHAYLKEKGLPASETDAVWRSVFPVSPMPPMKSNRPKRPRVAKQRKPVAVTVAAVPVKGIPNMPRWVTDTFHIGSVVMFKPKEIRPCRSVVATVRGFTDNCKIIVAADGLEFRISPFKFNKRPPAQGDFIAIARREQEAREREKAAGVPWL
jgi:hypothetical protein